MRRQHKVQRQEKLPVLGFEPPPKLHSSFRVCPVLHPQLFKTEPSIVTFQI